MHLERWIARLTLLAIVAVVVSCSAIMLGHAQPGPPPLNLTASSPLVVTPSGVGNVPRVLSCPSCGTGTGDVAGFGSVTANDMVEWLSTGGSGYQIGDAGFATSKVPLITTPTLNECVSWLTTSSNADLGSIACPTVASSLVNGNLVGATGAAAIDDSGLVIAQTPQLNVAQSWTAAQRGTPATLTISTSTFTPNFNTAQNFSMTLVHASCPCTLANPSTTLVPGQSGMIAIAQSATGSDTIGTYGSDYKFAGGTAPTLSTAANAVDFLPYYVFSTTQIIVGAGVLNAH